MLAGPGARDVLFRHRGTLLVLLAAPILATTFAGRALETWELAVGSALLVTGIALRLLAVRRIGKRARVARAGATALLCAGPYGRVRNPIYIANVAIIGGASVLAGLSVASVGVVLGALALYHAVVLVEESKLIELFGERYGLYCERVPRWLPRATEAPRVDGPPPLWPWSQVLRREVAAVLGVLALFLAITWIRLAGPGVDLLVGLIDRAAAAVGVDRPWFLAGATVLSALAEGAATHVKRRRHARLREQLLRAQGDLVAQGSTEALREEVEAHD